MKKDSFEPSWIPRLYRYCLSLKEQIAMLEKERAAMKQDIAQRKEQISELQEALKARKRISSNNSSQPPSQERKGNKKIVKKGGAVIGHEAHQRIQAKADTKIVLQAKVCPYCGEENLKERATSRPKEHLDIERGRFKCTHYIRTKYQCQCCRKHFWTDFPEGVMQSPFGAGLQAAVATLKGGRYSLSIRGISALLKELFGIKISDGAVAKIMKRANEVLREGSEEIKAKVREGDEPLYTDETGWREEGINRHLWTVGNSKGVFYEIHARRTKETRIKVQGGEPKGGAVTDRAPAYGGIETDHQYCLAHGVRNTQRFAEAEGSVGRIGQEVVKKWKRLLQIRRDWAEGKKEWKRVWEESESCRRGIRNYLLMGMHLTNKKFVRFCKKMLKDFEHFFVYLRIPWMEPTNNLAERNLRCLVIERKRSYGTKSKWGSEFVCRAKTVYMTLSQHGRSFFAYLREAFLQSWKGEELSRVYE